MIEWNVIRDRNLQSLMYEMALDLEQRKRTGARTRQQQYGEDQVKQRRKPRQRRYDPEKGRAYNRARMARIKADPERYAAWLERERERARKQRKAERDRAEL